MKFIVTTVYEDIDNAWLEWYLHRLEKTEVLPGSKTIVSELRKSGEASFKSEDPTSNSTATTSYRIIK